MGYPGRELVVWALGSSSPGRPVCNPRQTAAFRYSARYGPRPPCFARATVAALPKGDRLLIGGTASVRGEDSVHAGSLESQVDETFANLSALLAPGDKELPQSELCCARVYYARANDSSRLAALIQDRVGPGIALEFVRADICCAELLVEIEGLARPIAVLAPGLRSPAQETQI